MTSERSAPARDVDLDALGRLRGFELVAAGRQTVEMLMVDDEEKIAFLARASLVNRLYKAILPDKRANEFSRLRAVTKFLADAIAEYTERPDVSGVLGRVEQLLDESVAAKEYLIPESEADALFDLGAVDWKGLEEAFKQGRPRTAAQRLRSLLSAQIAALVRLNPMRVDLVERFEKLVADYNAGSMNTEAFFQELLAFKKTLTEEEARARLRGPRRRAPRGLRPPHAARAGAVRGREGRRSRRSPTSSWRPSSARSSSSTGASSRPPAPPCASPSRRRSTGCPRRSPARSTRRSATPSTSTCSTATGTTATPCTTWRRKLLVAHSLPPFPDAERTAGVRTPRRTVRGHRSTSMAAPRRRCATAWGVRESPATTSG